MSVGPMSLAFVAVFSRINSMYDRCKGVTLLTVIIGLL